MPRVEAPEKYLRETSNAGFRGPKKPKRMAEHRSHENRPVDGRAKNYRSEALGTGSESGFSTASLYAQGRLGDRHISFRLGGHLNGGFPRNSRKNV